MPRIDLGKFEIKEEQELAKPSEFLKVWSNMICSTEEQLNALESPNGNFLNETNGAQEVQKLKKGIERLKAYQEVLKKAVEKKDDWTPITHLKIEYTGCSVAEKNKYIELLLEFLQEMIPAINANENSDVSVNSIVYSDKSLLKNSITEIEVLYVAPQDKIDVLSNLWKQYLKTVQVRFGYLLEY